MMVGSDVKLVLMAKLFFNNKIYAVLFITFSVVISIDADRDSCLKTCVNGNCDATGECICDGCWNGPNCDLFFDRHRPHFKEKQTKLYLTTIGLKQNKPIFTAKAFDEDITSCQSTRRCLCADINYQMNGNDHLFKIDSNTGNIYVVDKDKLHSGNEYDMIVTASSFKSNYSDQLKIKAIVEENLGRVKRQAGRNKKGFDEGELNPTSFSLRTIAGEVNSLQLGGCIHYRLEISIPKSTVDLILEVSTNSETVKNFPALSLYNFTEPSRVPGLTFPKPEAKFYLSNKTQNVYDKMTVDFGQIKNSGSEHSLLTIYFSVTLTRNLPRKSESKHLVAVGAEYSKGSVVWVAQSQITTTPLTQSDDLVYSNFEFSLMPKTVFLDSAALFNVEANMEFRSDRLRVEITKPSFQYEPENIISLGHVVVNKFGKNYQAIPNIVTNYRSYRNKTVSEYSYSKSVLDMSVITNIGEKSRSFNNNPDNIMQFSFTIYALNYEENVGQNTSFTIKFYLGSKAIFTKTLNITIGIRKSEQLASMMLSSEGHFTNHNVSKGGLTQLKVTTIFSDFPRKDTFIDYSLLVEVPFAKKMPLFVPCVARLVNDKSGFNIPYMNALNIKPELETNQYTFDFGRIHLFKQRGNFTPNDNSITAEIAFRVSFHDDIDDGTILYANVKAMSAHKPLDVNIENNKVIVFPENRTSQIEFKSNQSVQWKNLIVNGGIGVNLDVELPANSAYQDFQIVLSKDPDVENQPELQICKFSLVKVGSELPCTCVQIENINQNYTTYGRLDGNVNSTIHDKAMLDLGAISIADIPSDSIRRSVLTNFVATIKSASEAIHEYSMKVDIVADEAVIRSEILTFPISTNETTPDPIHNLSPTVNFKLLGGDYVTPGFTTNILISVNVSPNAMGPLTIEVVAEDEELSICGLWIHHVGDNMPCVDKSTQAIYKSQTIGQNNIAKLQFDMVTNFGSGIRKSRQKELMDNALEFMTMVRVAESANANKTVKISVIHGHKSIKLEHELVIGVDKSKNALTEFAKPKMLVMKTADDNNMAYQGIAKLLYYDIELEKNSQAPITILMELTNDYKICNSAIVRLGKNYPCYSPHSLKATSGKFELGMICNTFLHNHGPEDNLLRLAVALRPKNEVPKDRPLKISSLAYMGKTPFPNKHELMLTVANADMAEFEDESSGATVHVDSDPIQMKIRERKWITFNVRIPPNTTNKLKIEAEGDADDIRTIVVLHDLKIVSGGVNIPCPLENSNHYKVDYNSTVPTNQINIITADLGYFSNFGFSYTINGTNDSEDRLEEDFLKMKILAELTDHPSIEAQGVYKIIIKTFYGESNNSVMQDGKILLTHNGEVEPNPQIDVAIKTKRKLQVLDRGDIFRMTATLKHLPESNSEPINTVLRLFTPEFIEILQIDSANTAELPGLINNTDGSTDISFPWILFSDEIVLNFTIQMDPKNLRGFGKEEVTVVTAYRVMCEHFRINVNTKSPCSQLKHFRVISKSSECDMPLGMENGNITDWQLSASSAISHEYSPQNARINSNKFWSPAIRNWDTEHYLQIDFGCLTRVVRLEYKSTRGQRRVTSYHLMYSQNGELWSAVNDVTSITFNGEDGESTIKNPVEARYYRFVIDEVDADKKSKNQYVAVRIELFGCYVQDDVQNLTLVKTHYTDDPASVNRHVAIDPYTNVIYFCDLSVKSNNQMCYYSDSNGQSWNVVGRSIDSIEGFELASGKFYAIDYDRPAYFCSNNGFLWTPIDYEEFNGTVSHPKFQKKLVIPQYHKDDIRKLDIHIGNWHVKYDGLFNVDSQYAKAHWKNCCGLN